MEAVRAHLPASLRPVVTLAYLTRWRLTSEVLPLEWRQVDWTRRVARLDPGTTRNRDGRTFPFTAALEALLKGPFRAQSHQKRPQRARESRVSYRPVTHAEVAEPADAQDLKASTRKNLATINICK